MVSNSPETFLYRATQGHSGCTYKFWSNIARQSVVTRRLRRAHLLRWKLWRLTLYHPVWIDSGSEKCQQREACGVLYSRNSDVRRSAQRSRVRPDESQNCSVQKSVEIQNTIYIGVVLRLLRRVDCSSIEHDPTQPSHTTIYLRYASRKWKTWGQEKNCTTECTIWPKMITNRTVLFSH